MEGINHLTRFGNKRSSATAESAVKRCRGDVASSADACNVDGISPSPYAELNTWAQQADSSNSPPVSIANRFLLSVGPTREESLPSSPPTKGLDLSFVVISQAATVGFAPKTARGVLYY
ncbi:hypothetical protein OPV22_022042 [Ensete ventricosum]|uniref:Uncharacterized protein n=1 Tax=Ensete ventricosum TaxID=4639 RepID=A0AAV8QRN5_ENSVE|nr:hypothetical protein OPV22_022042 [Ensete ventricosum]